VVGVTPAEGRDAAEVLDQAAAVERGSGHLLARTLVDAAEKEGRPPLAADHVVESPGSGVTGLVLGRRVTVGALSYLRDKEPAATAGLTALSGPGLRAYVAIDGAAAGVVLYADAVRPGIPALAKRLHALGARRIVMLSGDDGVNVATISEATGIDEARGDLLPADKAAAVTELERGGERVAMVGDGTNDAPALTAASVGVALAAGGSAISAEAADAVILGDDPSRIADAIAVGQHTMRIARQSIWWGLGLSGLLMVFAAAGMIVPAIGAMLQEGVDVAVILNALRAAR
jgi:P-type E1-E2 ATPase